jgi:hypothetical protein
MDLPMKNNQVLIVQRVKVSYFLRWIITGAASLWLNPWRLLLLSAACLSLFGLGLFAGSILQSNFVIVTIASLCLSLIFPLLLSCLAIAELKQSYHEELQFKLIFRQFWQGTNLRLVIVYALLVLLVSLSCSYLLYLLPEYQAVLSYILETILALLQIIMLIAIPANISYQGKPFHALAYGLRAFGVNFIACMLFLLVVFVILFAAIAVAKLVALLIGTWALIIYVLELWLFVTWLGLASAKMARDLFVVDA